MNRIYKIFLLLIVILGFQYEASASHMMGGDIAYECISPGKYKLVIKIYRDCRGIPFNSPDIKLFCKDGTNQNSVNYTRTAINDLTPTCSGGTAPCNPQNQTSSEGIEEHVFEAIVDFNTSPFKAMKDAGCCEILIKVEQCCRNGAITTISPGNFYTDAMINICNIGTKCNTSPQLSIPPVAYVCCNQPFTYNNGVREVIDGDSLAYELGTPLNANNSNETYTGSFTQTIPMTPYCPPNPGVINCRALPNAKPPRGFYFDKETGDIVFTPTKCDEVGVIVIKITEWRRDSATRKMRIIGFTRRDMQVVVKQCPDNNPPYFTGNNKYSVCEGNKICFSIFAKDDPYLPKQTRLDTVALTWNYGIPGATFTIVDPTAREKEAMFCWQTKIGDARSNVYAFTATAKDDNCPRPSSANKGYTVTVKPKARAKRKYDILDCGKLRFTAFPIDTVNYNQKNYRHKFTIRDSTNSGTPYYFGFVAKDSVKFKRGGKYIIEYEINNPPYNCPSIYSDTVIIPPVLDVQLKFGRDTFVCAGNSITLEPVVANGVPAYKYKWQVPIGFFDPKDTNSTYTLVKPTATTKLLLVLTDKNKCVDSDTVTVHYQPNPIVDIGPDQRICTYNNVTLDAQNADTMRYFWQPNGDSTRQITVNIAGKYIAKVIDHLGCNTSDTMELFVNDTVVAIAKPDREICIFDTLKVKGQRRPKGYTRTISWRDIASGTNLATDSSFKLKITTMVPKDYEMYLKVTQGGVECEDKDTFNLVVNALPTFKFLGLPPRCYADGAINLTQSNITKAFSGDNSESTNDVRYFQQFKKPSWVTGGPVGVNVFVYDFPKFIKNSQVPKAGLRDTICYDFRDYKGCYNKECKPTRLNPNPDVYVRDSTYCQKAGLITLDRQIVRPFSKIGGIESWRVIDVPVGSGVDPMAILAPDMTVTPNTMQMDPGQEGENEKTGTYTIEYCFADAITSCKTCDTAFVRVIKLPEIEFTGMPKLCINDPLAILDSFVIDKVNGGRFPSGTWETIEYGGSRDLSNPNIAPKIQKSMVNKKLFDPKYGAGQYIVKLTDVSSGCPVTDSTEILVNGLPIIQIDVPDTVCSSSPAFTLNNILPSGNVGKWTGVGVTGRDFNPSVSAKTKQYEGPIRVKFAYTNPLTGCTSSDSQTLLVQSQPEVNITTPKPYQQCEGKDFDLTSAKNWASRTKWSTNGDGNFNKPDSLPSKYFHGFNDTAINGMSGKVRLTLSTLKEGVCPIAKDYIDLIIEAYPQFDFMGDPEVQCEPAIVNFTAMVAKPAGSPNLRYNWWYGNGDSLMQSTTFNPPNIKYDTAKRTWYDVTLIVDNQWGVGPAQACSIRKDSIGYIKVLPQPKVGFSSDPGFFTTVAFPKFKFFDETKVRWQRPDVKMDYEWNFGSGDVDDTSTKMNPIHSYTADTMKYYVHLTSTIRYQYKNQEYICWDSISQLRKIGPDVTVFVPTAFSPEKTGPVANNVFKAVVNGEKTFHIELFNRWGEMLWKTDDKNASWDGFYRGIEAQQDVYMWVIKVTAYDGEEYQYEGTVTLLR